MSSFTPGALSHRIIILDGWRAAFVAIAAGAACVLALAPLHWSPVIFLAVPVFVWLLDGAVAPVGAGRIRAFLPAFWRGWMFGFGYFLAGLWWLGSAFLVDVDDFGWLLPFAVVGLPAVLAFFWAIAAALTRSVWTSDWTRLVAFAALFTLAEYARGTLFTGFPWNLFGYTLMPFPVWMQSASLVGTYGMTFIAFLLASSLAIFAPGDDRRPRRMRAFLGSMVALLLLHTGFGLAVLAGADDGTQAGVKLRLVQPAVDQANKWEPEQANIIFQSYLDLSASNTGPQTSGVASFSHILWPESAFPFILAEQPGALSSIANLLPPSTHLITGAMRTEAALGAEGERRTFNSMLMLNGEAEIIQARDKTHLVPFGEYLPFQNQLERLGLRQLTQLRGGFSAGTERRMVQQGDTPPFQPLICYEVIYPGAVTGQGERPRWFVNLTNDAWFGATPGPYQHAHQARLRAVEEGIPMVRLANSGMSFVSDAYGRVVESLPLGFRGVLDSDLPNARAITIYGRTGNWPVVAFCCVLLILLVGANRAGNVRL